MGQTVRATPFCQLRKVLYGKTKLLLHADRKLFYIGVEQTKGCPGNEKVLQIKKTQQYWQVNNTILT